MRTISTRDLEIFNNLVSQFDNQPEDFETVHRKFRACLNDGLFDIPGSRIGFSKISGTKQYWFLACTAELNRFFITLEQKYGFDGHKETVDSNTGDIVPIRRLANK